MQFNVQIKMIQIMITHLDIHLASLHKKREFLLLKKYIKISDW